MLCPQHQMYLKCRRKPSEEVEGALQMGLLMALLVVDQEASFCFFPLFLKRLVSVAPTDIKARPAL